MEKASGKIVNWKDYGLEEYLLVVNPDEAVHEKIVAEKKSFFESYGERVSVKTLPHISVACFLGKELMEETLIRWIQRICDQQKCFNVTLNNYSGFPEHTIFLRVQNPLQLQNFTNGLQLLNGFIRSSACPPLHLNRKPHMSIARRLPRPVYNKAMIDYSQKTFHESFLAKELVLLKRSHQFEACKKVNVFHFKP